VFDNEPLNDEQKEALADCISSLEAYVKKYKISSEPLDEDYAQELAETDSKRIFSIEADVHVSPAATAIRALESPLMAGYDEFGYEFFESQIPWEEDNISWPYTEIFFACSTCEDSDSSSSACSVCTEGQFIYELLWDENGKVSFERTQ
jgi:hypothetical protein